MGYDVSVVMPLLNPDLRRVKKSIESVWNQDCMVQLVIVNDGSIFNFAPKMDDTFVVNLSENVGVAEAMNRGLAQASGDYCLNMGDDWLRPGMLRKVLDALRGSDDPVHTWGYSDVEFEGSHIHRTPEWKPHQPGDGLKTSGCIMFHRSLFPRAQYYRPPGMEWYVEDYDFILQLEVMGCRGLHVPGPMLVHTPGEQTEEKNKRKAEIRQVMWDRWGKLRAGVA